MLGCLGPPVAAPGLGVVACTQPVEKLGRAGREKISERVRVEMTVVLLTVASRCKSASSCIYAIKPVELLVRYK